MLQKCKADGWRVTLVYLRLPSPEDAVERVAKGVQRGGYCDEPWNHRWKLVRLRLRVLRIP